MTVNKSVSYEAVWACVCLAHVCVCVCLASVCVYSRGRCVRACVCVLGGGGGRHWNFALK